MRIVADQIGVGDLPVVQAYLQRLRAARDVAVGENQAVRRENEARAAPGDALAALGRGSAPAHVDPHHGGTDRLRGRHHRPGIGIEQRHVAVGGTCSRGRRDGIVGGARNQTQMGMAVRPM